MTVGVLVDCFYYELGHSDFVHSFFSTVSYHLEKEGWGTKYPLLMNDLYNNELSWNDVKVARTNLIEIEQQLSKLSPEHIIWDLDVIKKETPWGETINPKTTNLANYFATADGETFFEVILKSMGVAVEDKCDMKLKEI